MSSRMDAETEAIGAPSPLTHAIPAGLVPVIAGREAPTLPSFPRKRQPDSHFPLAADEL